MSKLGSSLKWILQINKNLICAGKEKSKNIGREEQNLRNVEILPVAPLLVICCMYENFFFCTFAGICQKH